ncbi:anti-sigma factor domain-containing protein [Deinococcus radiotolerans]|uniref:Anti-sigma K factor RskA C-terminal domain-containing protein n=1 Tax=Deinococcus radiotolerans TaxID=1309407 RepID=A0ABQ2FDI4_9DEIO|nr:anti-sigma factor [Deinococcus radiotolerans]GGK87771.1 hypothetical protein GCM10010844_02890 [Deinococcus radiotolerans]
MTISRDDILALALGQLGPEDERRVRAAIDADPALAREYRADLDLLHSLPDTLPPAEVPAGAEARLIERLRRETSGDAPPANLSLNTPEAPVTTDAARPAPGRMNWRLMLLAVVAALTLGVLFLRPPSTPDLLSQYQSTPGAQMQPLTQQGTTLGELVRLPDGRGYLHLNAMAPQDRVYQLWRIEDGKPVSVGVFEGQGIVLPTVQAGQTVAVSVEPVGGSEQPTTTPILVQAL